MTSTSSPAYGYTSLVAARVGDVKSEAGINYLSAPGAKLKQPLWRPSKALGVPTLIVLGFMWKNGMNEGVYALSGYIFP